MSDHPTHDTSDVYAAPYPTPDPSTPDDLYAAAPAGSADEGSGSSTAQAVKDGVGSTASQAASSTSDVVGTAKAETGEVLSTAVGSARELLDQTRSELANQAGTQHERVTKGLHSLADELESMGEQSDSSGLASSLVKQVSERARTTADWMGQREPGDLVTEARQFAARKPGTFLAAAAALGFLGARLTRGLGAAASAQDAAPAPAHGQDVSVDTAGTVGARLDQGPPTVTTTSHGQPVTYTSGGAVPGSLDPLDALDPLDSLDSLDGRGATQVRP